MENIWTELIEYARWAPSPHNAQPWKLRLVDDRKAELLYDPARLLPVIDPSSAYTIVGLGMFIEALRIAAASFGFGIEIDNSAEPRLEYGANELRLFARIKLVQTDERPTIDPNLLLKRRTSRGWYRSKPAGEAAAHTLARIGGVFGYRVTCNSNSAFVRGVIALYKDLLFLDLDSDRSRTELARWMRTSSGEAHRTMDGLWSRCMKFSGWVLYLLFHHPRLFHASGVRAIVGKLYTFSMNGTASVLWIEGPFSNRVEWMQAGRMLLNIWIEITRLGLVIHPFGSIIANPMTRTKFVTAARRVIPETDPWFLARLGVSRSEPVRSLRLSVQDIIAP